jgi:hypothetical protein
MRVTSIAKFGIGLTALTLLAGAICATPAFADPSDTTARGTLVGVGSDTTQDLMNGIAGAINSSSSLDPRIASYDATDSAGVVGGSITTRKNGTPISRPNGSGAGVDALLVSIGAANTLTSGTTWTSADTLGQVDFARSSSGPSGAATAAGSALTYIPYARDAVDYAVSSTSAFPTLSLGASNVDADVAGVAPSTLFSIYDGIATQIVTGLDGDPRLVNDSFTPAIGETLTPIHAYVPQAGSGTRKFWLPLFGLTDANVDSTTAVGSIPGRTVWDQHVTTTAGVTSADSPAVPVEEHDGTELQGDAGAIMPFSIGKYIADKNGLPGVVDHTNGAVLGELGGVVPTTGTVPNLALNSVWTATNATATRLVYNVVPTAEVANENSLINWTFVGTGSLVCSQKDTIAAYGFGVLTAAQGSSSACGDTSRQAFATSTPTVTLATPLSVVYGGHFAATATVTSFGNGGGTVAFKNNGVTFDTETIAAGAASSTVATSAIAVSATLGNINAFAITADFTPALDGVEEAVSPVGTVAVTKAHVTVKASAAAISHTKSPTVKITVSAAGFVPTGTVTVKAGTKTLKNAVVLVHGAATFTISRQSVGTHTFTVIYSGSATAVAKTITFRFVSK